ncbi:MAG: DUF1003 domain-containing protein [Gammaproteobacteria bacterium]|nr:DUF1003 domain-containing protein [Gammaproteobacteria bacterium]
MTTETEVLADVPLFALMDESERAFLAERLQRVRCEAGQQVFAYGDPARSMYIVQSGEIELSLRTKTGESIIFGVLGAGDFFGEISLLDGGPRTATARAMTTADLLEISREDLDALFRLKPAAALELLSATGSRLRNATQLLRNTSARNANDDLEENRGFFVRLTDWIAQFAGSMLFLALHVLYFALWLGWNILGPASARFDAFPFGLLTLVVTLETIILSVFVLLSQNRQVERDRVRNDIEYDVNLKAEMQIAHMHEKLDEHYAASHKRMDGMERQLGEVLALLRERDRRA